MMRCLPVVCGLLGACGTPSEAGDGLPFGNACERLVDYLVDDCGLGSVSTDEDSDIECRRGSVVACQSECGLAAPCDIFQVPDDPTEQTYLDAVSDYTTCITGC